ncbi:MAG: membrane-bound O-acyltransferase family protein [Crocinitomicaceae bacterium]|nr:membrane-bound O-acyltransferase family protein [Crocinitomicaceae bacterium]
MQFNSATFAVFMLFVLVFYWFFLNHPKRLNTRNSFILCVSYLFYGWWDWRFLSLIVISSGVDFVVGLKLGEEEKDRRQRKIWLGLSLLTNLGMLGAFKYFNFFLESADVALQLFGLNAFDLRLQWILPVGISFYTFQTLSYTIDIYRGQLKPVSNPISFFAFVAFFPQLVAGPIERAKLLLPQFENHHKFNEKAVKSGLLLVLWGLFKKIVIADRLALYVNEAYMLPGADISGPIAITAIVFFTLQLYVDFSAYSEIAIGLARMLGFKLSTNFVRPLLANGFADLWARWHISLTTWFRDYIMLPLRKLPNGKRRRALNVMIVFFITGLWHGASWTFVLWGLVNGGFLLLFEPFVIRPLNQLPNPISRILRTGFTTIFMYGALVLFRAPDLNAAGVMYAGLFNWSDAAMGMNHQLLFSDNEWIFGWFLVIGLLSFEAWQEYRGKLIERFYEGPGLKRWLVAYVLVMATVILGSYGVYVLDKQFIYFQF